jgi:hypothetical protein
MPLARSSTVQPPAGDGQPAQNTPPWSVQEGKDQCFRVYDATGFFICAISHREDLHVRSFQYADDHMRREEARRVAKAISRWPDLLKRPTY